MPQTQVHAGWRPGRRALALAPLTAAAAAVCCVTACGGGTAATASATPGSSIHAVSPAAPSGSDSPAGQDQGTAAAGLRTPGAALAQWMHRVAAGHRRAACQDMAQPGLSAQRSMAACMSAAGTGTFGSLHSALVTDGVEPSSTIRATAHIKGTSATVDANDIRVSGTTLMSLMMAHGTGVKPGEVSMSFDLSRIDGAWYVTDMNLQL